MVQPAESQVTICEGKKAALLLQAGVFAALRVSPFVEEQDKNLKGRKILKAASCTMHRWKIHIMHKNSVGLQAPALYLVAFCEKEA